MIMSDRSNLAKATLKYSLTGGDVNSFIVDGIDLTMLAQDIKFDFTGKELPRVSFSIALSEFEIDAEGEIKFNNVIAKPGLAYKIYKKLDEHFSKPQTYTD